MIINPSEHNHRDVYKILIGSVVPRPIAFVSTIGASGARNLAPFSFFNAVCSDPPTVLFCTSFKMGVDGSPVRKDTLRNVRETGEFVVNIVSEEIAEAMNMTSGDYPPDVDEFVVSGLTAVPSGIVKPPRVKESLVNMECKLQQIVTVSERPGGGSVVIGEVVLFHVNDGIISDFRIDPEMLKAIGRMGGNSYARTTDRFDLVRPKIS